MTPASTGLAPPAAGRGYLCVVLHDVAPSRWAGCRRVMAHLHTLATQAGVPLHISCLVVPRMHGAPPTAAFIQWLHQLADEGHELVLHGWTHRDEVPLGGGWVDACLRRVYTCGEGEFAALNFQQAWARLARGRAWMKGEGLAAQGFVAPAWLMSPASWQAVEAAGFSYTCTLNEVVSLPGRQRLHSRSLVFSTRNAWRRLASVGWNNLQAVLQQHGPLLRLELHPTDADHGPVRDCWSKLLSAALRQQRQPMTLTQACSALLPQVPAVS